MDDSKRWALQLNYKSLVRDLQVEDVQDHMIGFGVMDEDDMEKIMNSGKCRKERTAAFIAQLKRRGPDAFGHFVDALGEKQKYLSEKLRDDAKMMAKRVGRGASIEVDVVTLQNILRDNDRLRKVENELLQLQREIDKLAKINDTLSDRLIRERKRSDDLTEEGETMRAREKLTNKNISTLLDVVGEKRKQADEVVQDVEELQARLYQMEEKLNLKEEAIKRLEYEKRQVEGNVIKERRMVNNLRGHLESYKKDVGLLERDVERIKWERNAARTAADHQGHKIQELQRELMMTKQLKNNCETIIKHLNGTVRNTQQEARSKRQEAHQAQRDLGDLLQQYLSLKETVS